MLKIDKCMYVIDTCMSRVWNVMDMLHGLNILTLCTFVLSHIYGLKLQSESDYTLNTLPSHGWLCARADYDLNGEAAIWIWSALSRWLRAQVHVYCLAFLTNLATRACGWAQATAWIWPSYANYFSRLNAPRLIMPNLNLLENVASTILSKLI
jgi:hypothetical protein